MANPWFRLYHEFATDPKLQMMSEADQRRYVMVLCLKCCNDDVTLHDKEVAFQLRISEDEWLITKKLFLDKDLICQDNKPIAWNKRQFLSDSSTERVAKHREKKKAGVKQKGNVTVTPPDSDSDSDNKNNISFSDFWNRYPRKTNKVKAEVTWKRLSKKDAALAYADIENRYDGIEKQFIPHATTYLNGKRWEDEPIEKIIKQSNKPMPRGDAEWVNYGKLIGDLGKKGESMPVYVGRLRAKWQQDNNGDVPRGTS